jgi:hypothetical protein
MVPARQATFGYACFLIIPHKFRVLFALAVLLHYIAKHQ